MSYRCDICGTKVLPRTPRLVYQVTRQRQIVRELGVCEGCLALLRVNGLTYFRDPYYRRLHERKEVGTATVAQELPERAPLPIEQLGRPAKKVEL